MEIDARGFNEDALLHAFASEAATRILSGCVGKAHSARELVRATDLPHSTVYRTIAKLVEDRLLVVERSALTEDGKRYDLYRSTVRNAQISFDRAGIQIHWELIETGGQNEARLWRLL